MKWLIRFFKVIFKKVFIVTAVLLIALSVITNKNKCSVVPCGDWFTQNFELRIVREGVHVGSAQVSTKIVFPWVFCTDVVDEQGAVSLLQVTQQLCAAFIALMHNVCACLEDDRRKELGVRLSKVPDAMNAPVWSDTGWINESTRDNHTGVCHGWDVSG